MRVELEPTERTVQDDQAGWPEITSAIGRVVATSAWATIALQEMASAITGSESVFFLMEDGTMGSQVRQAKTLIQGPERWTYQGGRPPFSRECREAALRCLSVLGWLTPFRNRIVHDAWYPDERVGDGDGALGRRATRFGKTEVLSRRATFHRVGYGYFIATTALNETTLAIWADREGADPEISTAHLQRANEALSRLDARRQDADAGRDGDWLWSERPMHFGLPRT